MTWIADCSLTSLHKQIKLIVIMGNGKFTQKYYDKNAVHVDDELPSIIYVHVFCCLMTKNVMVTLCGIPHYDQNTRMAMTL